MYTSLRSLAVMAALAAAATLALPQPVFAASAAELRRDAQAALNSLYAKNPGAKAIGKDAVAVLVFPSVVKAGLGIGGPGRDRAGITEYRAGARPSVVFELRARAVLV